MTRDYFEVLGVPRRFAVTTAELEAQYLALSKQLHPDRWARATPRERLEAVQKTTELNDAYRVLKDPVKRAEYLLKREGLDIADEKGGVKAAPTLLMEMMERNEALAEARAAGDAPAVARMAAEMRASRASAMRTVENGFARVESGDRAALALIAQALVAMRYHARFLEQVEAFESRVEA
jgi:molecular chaperone HscB